MIAPGQRVGHYLIELRLGAGGMGEVFRAFDESLERPVAIKVLPKAIEGHPEARARMLREARAASALVHAGIVTVHEVDEHDGQTILVMELVEGETFSHIVARRGKLPAAEALGLVRQVGAALEFAHKAGFVHRDIKCSNLMLTPDGRVKVLDFGLSKRMNAPAVSPDTVGIRKPAPAPAPMLAPAPGADAATIPGKPLPPALAPPTIPSHDHDARDRVAAAAARDDLTVDGVAMGTPGYSALELMDGLPADGRADVFSLGVVLYELVTAARPYSGTDWKSVRAQIVAENYVRARTLVPELSSELDDVIVRALKAERDQRTPSAAAMMAELSHASAARKSKRRLVLALGAVAALGGTTWAAITIRNRGADRDPAAGDGGLAVVDPGPADATAADAVLPPPAAAIALTRTNGCVYSPVFLDEQTVAFDLTTPAGARDIATLALAPAAPAGTPPATRGAVPRPMVRPGTHEVRPAPGLAPGELLFVVHDQANRARSFVAARDLASGTERELVGGPHLAAAAQDGAYYYLPHDSRSLRRVRDKRDEAVLSLDSAGAAVALVAARDGQRLLVSGRNGTAGTLCVVDLTTSTVDCPVTQDALGARPDLGASGTIFYASRGGIRGRNRGGDDVMAVAGAVASGGLAVSPSGATLVWSDCGPRQVLRDTYVKPIAELAIGDDLTEPVAGPGGRLAWVQRGGELVVRTADGTTVALTVPGEAAVASPAFDVDGGRLAFARASGDEPGIWLVEAGDPSTAQRLTTEPGDSHPVFQPDGAILFTRTVDGQPYVHRVRVGGVAEAVMPEARRTVDVDRGSGRVLLRSADDRYFFWWDPATSTETPGPPSFAPASNATRSVSLSPDGSWIIYRAGERGDELWRTTQGLWQPERLVPTAEAITGSTITDDGHVLVVTPAWRGELWRLDAAAASPW